MTEQVQVKVGDCVLDVTISTVGQVVDIVGGLIHLRPLDGGPVWARDRRAVRAVTTEEGISAKLNARNRASRSGR